MKHGLNAAMRKHKKPSRGSAPQTGCDTPWKSDILASSLPEAGSRSGSPVRSLWAPACILLAAMVVYGNSLSAQFLFDSVVYVRDNPLWHQAWPPWACLEATLRPLATWSFAWNYTLFGPGELSYRLVNLAIHVLAAWVLYGIVWRTLLGPGMAERYAGRARRLALAAALTWVVHPLQTESVTYIYQRYESLMGLFFLLSLYTFIRGAQRPRVARPSGTREEAHVAIGSAKECGFRGAKGDTATVSDLPLQRAWYGLSVVCCLASLACKEVGGMIPLVILWYDRAFLAPSWRELLRRRGLYYGVLGGVFGLLAAVVLLHVRFYQGGGLLYWNEISPWRYALSQPGVILHYLQLCFWPQGQCLDYHWPVAERLVDIVPQGLAIGALAGLTAAAVLRIPRLSFLGGWFFLILAPSSSFLPIVDLAFEHRMYLPLAAVVVAVVLAVDELPRRWGWQGSRRRRYDRCWLALLAVVLVALGLTTVARNRLYAGDLPMWWDVVQKAPENPRAYTNLGAALNQIGDHEHARQCCREAIRLDPFFSRAYLVMGNAVASPQEAATWYRWARRLNLDDADAANNLGLVLLGLGRTDEAIRQLREAVKLNSCSPKYHKSLSTGLAHQGQFEAALAEFRVARQWQPDITPPGELAAWMRSHGVRP